MDRSKYRKGKLKSIQRLFKQEACGRLVVLLFFTCAFGCIFIAHIHLIPLIFTHPINSNASTLLSYSTTSKSLRLPAQSWFGSQTLQPISKHLNNKCTNEKYGKADEAINNVHAYLFSSHKQNVDPTLDLYACAPIETLQSCSTLKKMWNSLYTKAAYEHVNTNNKATVSEFKQKIKTIVSTTDTSDKNTNEYNFFMDDNDDNDNDLAFTMQGDLHFKPIGLLSLFIDLFGMPSRLDNMNVLNVGEYSSLSFILKAMGAAKVTSINGQNCEMTNYISTSFGLSIDTIPCKQDIYDVALSLSLNEQYQQHFDVVISRLPTAPSILSLRILYNFIKPGGVLLFESSSISESSVQEVNNGNILPEPDVLVEWMKTAGFEQVSATSSLGKPGARHDNVVVVGRKKTYQAMEKKYRKGWSKEIC